MTMFTDRASFRVQRTMCSTCIYRPDSPLDLANLERQVADKHGGFKTYRACHHTKDNGVCCRGFWERHRDKFILGQLAQRLKRVLFVDVDDFPGMSKRNRRKNQSVTK